MREQDLQDLAVRTARAHGVLAYHTYDSRKSEPGFLDLVLVGRQGVLYRELKSATGTVTPEQEYWMAALLAAGEDVDVWRPAQWDDGTIEREIRALGRVQVRRPEPTQAQIRKHLQRKGMGPQS